MNLRMITSLCILLTTILLLELTQRIGPGNPLYVPQPSLILQTLTDIQFVGRFGIMLVQVAVSSLVGGVIGVGLANLLFRSAYITRVAIHVLEMGVWFPLVICWALPMWPTKDLPGEGWFDPIFWAALAAIVLIIPALILFATWKWLSIGRTPGVNLIERRRGFIFCVAVHAFLVALISQLLITPHGWLWLFKATPEGTAVGYSALLLIALALLSIKCLCRVSFYAIARQHIRVVTAQLTDKNWTSVVGSFVTVFACLSVWQLFSVPLKRDFLISSPVTIANAAYKLVTGQSSIVGAESSLWYHFGLSAIELIAGLSAGGGLAFVACRVLLLNGVPRRLAEVIPVILAISLFPQIFFLNWRVLIGSAQTIIGVAFLVTVPFIQLLWASRGEPTSYRLLLCLADSLPLAFLAVFFGEALSAVGGIGFLTVVGRARFKIDAGLAIAVMSFILLVSLWCTLRGIAKRIKKVS